MANPGKPWLLDVIGKPVLWEELASIKQVLKREIKDGTMVSLHYPAAASQISDAKKGDGYYSPWWLMQVLTYAYYFTERRDKSFMDFLVSFFTEHIYLSVVGQTLKIELTPAAYEILLSRRLEHQTKVVSELLSIRRKSIWNRVGWYTENGEKLLGQYTTKLVFVNLDELATIPVPQEFVETFGRGCTEPSYNPQPLQPFVAPSSDGDVVLHRVVTDCDVDMNRHMNAMVFIYLVGDVIKCLQENSTNQNLVVQEPYRIKEMQMAFAMGFLLGDTIVIKAFVDSQDKSVVHVTFNDNQDSQRGYTRVVLFDNKPVHMSKL